jgi:hypothetical protein
MTAFDPSILRPECRAQAEVILGASGHTFDKPDLVIAPNGDPYLYRWHLWPRNETLANAYFHVQVASDPERPLHDHPWDNCSHILGGRYREIIDSRPHNDKIPPEVYTRKVGQLVYRKAEWAHRLILPKDEPYAMTVFTTGPKLRVWGFWFDDGWRPYTDVIEDVGDLSVFKVTT